MLDLMLLDPFNRTIVELKPRLHLACDVQARPFNRTIVELKLLCNRLLCRVICTFNRTIVELKHLRHYHGYLP